MRQITILAIAFLVLVSCTPSPTKEVSTKSEEEIKVLLKELQRANRGNTGIGDLEQALAGIDIENEDAQAAAFNKFEYRGFKKTKSFGGIDVKVKGDAKKIGLNQNELLEYVMLRFKNNFSTIKYEPIDFSLETLSEETLSEACKRELAAKDAFSQKVKRNEATNADWIRARTLELDCENSWAEVGWLTVTVWVTGDDFPVAYHLTVQAGHPGNTDSWEDAVLGYGSKENVPGQVKKNVDELIEKLAIDFYKARGQM